jgi:nicotinamide mononucleotide adenylyltransferase
MKYNLFIGRFQSPHKGHQEIFNNFLSKNQPILIAIRDVETDLENPLNAHQVMRLWKKIYENNPLVKVIIIPDIESVNYGRGVGYEVNEIKVSKKTAAISATDIRNQILQGKEDWKELVSECIHEPLERIIKASQEPSE